ncbi:MAG: hypothetical protein AAGC46_09655 [Solirubrobacteraceae bacterium]|nr:hypothetical protein [Patulibacter sp.]
MVLPASRRLAFTALATLATTAAVAGCGSDGGSGGASSGASASSTDGATLLKAAFKPSDASSGYVAVNVKGTIDVPKDDELRHLAGEANLTVSYGKQESGKLLPPLAVAFDVDGDYVDGKGKSGKGKYSGGITYAADQLYANWEGQDYAVGSALTNELMSEIQKEAAKEGVSATSPLGGVDPQKLLDAMDLDPDTWFKSTTVTDGGQVEGEDTQKISGPVDVKAVADDITSGLKALPAAVPQLPGVDKLKQVDSISDSDLADAEKAIKVLDASIWVGKDDHLERQIQVHLKADDQTGDDPGSGDVTLTITNTATPKPIVAPKTSTPITDLILKLEKQFGGPGGPLEGLMGGQTA